MHPKDGEGIANSVDPDQTASLGAVWSGSALFAQTCLSENLGKLQYAFKNLFFFVFSPFENYILKYAKAKTNEFLSAILNIKTRKKSSKFTQSSIFVLNTVLQKNFNI